MSEKKESSIEILMSLACTPAPILLNTKEIHVLENMWKNGYVWKGRPIKPSNASSPDKNVYSENHQSLIKGQNSLWFSSAIQKEVYGVTEQQNHASEEAASQRILIWLERLVLVT